VDGFYLHHLVVELASIKGTKFRRFPRPVIAYGTMGGDLASPLWASAICD
jgi:hypothetical protein